MTSFSKFNKAYHFFHISKRPRVITNKGSERWLCVGCPRGWVKRMCVLIIRSGPPFFLFLGWMNDDVNCEMNENWTKIVQKFFFFNFTHVSTESICIFKHIFFCAEILFYCISLRHMNTEPKKTHDSVIVNANGSPRGSRLVSSAPKID